MKWISVKDKLPEKERLVLLYFDGGYGTAFWFGGEEEPPFPIDKPISELIWLIGKDFQWSKLTLSKELGDEYGYRRVNLYEEDYKSVYWMPLPPKPEGTK